jgi:hypothetical protein
MVYAGGYLEVLRRYLLRSVIDVEHPPLSPAMEQPPSIIKHGTTVTATGTAAAG